MYYSRTQFRARANSKLKANGIQGGEITKEELDNLYRAWCMSTENSFKDFFNSFAFITIDEIEDIYDVEYEIAIEFTGAEILEYLAKEVREIESFMQLSNDLFLVRA